MKASGLIRNKMVHVFLHPIRLVGGDESDVSQNLAHIEATALVRNFVVRGAGERPSLRRALGES
ncbi:hypothetical protein JZ00_22550 [Pseudomonas frederiksbergensis]|uniref:Uncharacterized protein n=1 Tax=Pseudomonas frederiksbergensis TaxID=104087 RepID=A0A0B1YZI7_9PSED|nr:hypothetical protein JZ00_22550 [Pseudomonas frederiksbergensis]